MAGFIQLTRVNADGAEWSVWVNRDYIGHFYQASPGVNVLTMAFSAGDKAEWFYVKETPDEILGLLMNT